jgi:hypothetical protein
VFAYLVLLSVSRGTAAFLLVVCLIFLLYIIWDFLTFREYYADYNLMDNRAATYLREIANAITKPSTLHHKLSTIIAFIWFLEVYGTHLQIKSIPGSLYAIAVAVFLGLLVYRFDQARKNANAIPFIVAVVSGFIVFVVAATIRGTGNP